VTVLAGKQVDGLILVPAPDSDGAHLAPLVERHIPVVLLDRPLANLATDTVMIDNVAAARRAVHYLATLGHRRIAMLAAQPVMSTSAARLAGYRQAMDDIGIPAPERWVRIIEYVQAFADVGVTAPDRWGHIMQHFYACAQVEAASLLALPDTDRPTAFFAEGSTLAAGVFRAIQDSGLACPREVSLIGFDDVEWMSLVQPPITVVDQPVYELGRQAAERLVARIEGEESPPQQIWLEAQLIVRQSCAPPFARPSSVTA
jgi:LacI family transcriptional regulator